MRLVLDSEGLTVLAADRARLAELRRRGEWPPLIPTVVLTESLTGDHRRDYHENRVLRACDVRPVDSDLARAAAALRTAAMGTASPSAVDAVVVALADRAGGATVLTADVEDLRALAAHATNEVRVVDPAAP